MERICPECGTAANPEARFCMSCGAGLQESAQPKFGANSVREVSSIALAPLAMDLPGCLVAIQEVNAEGPDDDGDMRIEVKYEVTNDTDEDWEYLEVCTQILNAAGLIIEETRDTQEQTIITGESAEFESGLWGIKAKVLGPHPEKTHVVVSVIACGMSLQPLGEIAIPYTPFEPVALKPVKVGDVLQLVSGSLWKTEPDDDKDCRVEIKALVQNLTDKHLPQVKLNAKVTDKAGRELTDAGGADEVRPGDLCVISGSGYGKEKKMDAAMVAISIHAYWRVAAGVTQANKLAVADSESSQEGYMGNIAENDGVRLNDDDFVTQVRPTCEPSVDDNKFLSSDGSHGASGAPRSAVFTFRLNRNANIDLDAVGCLCAMFGENSINTLLAFCPNGYRDIKTEKIYELIDKVLLPQITYSLFFDNFSNPGLLFVEPTELIINAGKLGTKLIGSRIVYFAIWDADETDGGQKRLEIEVEAIFELKVVGDVDIENPDDYEDTEIGDQLRECTNMFNISFDDFEYEDENEVLNHDWNATFVNATGGL